MSLFKLSLKFPHLQTLFTPLVLFILDCQDLAVDSLGLGAK